MDIEKEREAFKQHLTDTGLVEFAGYGFAVDECDEYLHEPTQVAWDSWLIGLNRAKAQVVPEGFVLLQIKDAKFFSHDGDNYEVHDTLVEAKYEAESAIEHYRERLADQLSDPRSDGNFQDVGYGVVLAKSGYSIDHVVTQDDIDKGEYSYEVGTEILSLYLSEAQEQSHE